MKLTLIIIGLLGFAKSFGQLNLSKDEREILKEICSQYNVSNKESTLKKLIKTSPSKFESFISELIASKENSSEILNSKYFTRPTNDDLNYWYVLREFHYNNLEPDSLKKTKDQILDWLSKEKIDDRWLLDNYFYRIGNRIEVLFNKADLSERNFNVEALGYKDETEKAMFVLFLINTCGQRLSVMKFTGKGDQESVVKRFPKIDGKCYYYYKDFDYVDFNWVGYKTEESYNRRHIGNFYEVLLNHLNLLLKNKKTDEARELYRESILSKPAFFQYSDSKKILFEFYENSNEL